MLSPVGSLGLMDFLSQESPLYSSSFVDNRVHVICGEWECGLDGEWLFTVDKEKLARIIPVYDGISLNDMEEAVSREFGIYEDIGVCLSYWSPSSLKFLTGKKTPPVMVTTGVGLAYYLKLAQQKKGLNLFVKFKMTSKRNVRKGTVEARGSNVVPAKRRCGEEDVLPENPTAASKPNPVAEVDLCHENPNSAANIDPIVDLCDEDILAEVLAGEAKIGVKRGPIVSEAGTDYRCDGSVEEPEVGGEESTEDYEDEVEETQVEEEELVRPVGYDKEFWSNFLNEDLGGSNAVDVMCSGLDGVEIKEDVGKKEKTVERWTSPCGQDEPGPSRKLEDVDDDEFDIPPLFDDTEYEVDEIPDLDRDDDDGVYVGKVYASKENCQIGLAIYAIKNMINFKQTTTKRDYFVVTCPAENCDWRVMAHEKRESGYYEIRKAQLEHTCSVETRKQYMKKATSRVIVAVYKSKYGQPAKGPKPMDLQQLILEELRVSATYSKCWRAREKAVEEVQGVEEETFSKLPEYLHLLKLANPGTITDIVTDIEDDGSERFMYMFLAFGASIEGFRNLRRVLVVDGTHLSGKYKGVLLTASGQDANFQVFPLAFAVVDSENDDSWTWFFQKLERIIADSITLTILSDRHQSIYVAKSRVFPKAHHGACIVHLERNVTARFKSKGLAKMVKNAGCEFKIAAFRKLYKEIKSRNHECALYLEKIGMAHWTRVYFQGDRYNLMTSNIAETLNKALLGGRSSPILELIKFIRAMLTRWFSARRKKSQKHKELVPPYVDKVMTKNMLKMKASKVGNTSSWSFEIVGQFGEINHVLLDTKRCNCKVYDKLKIPCGHALMAANSKKVEYSSLVGDFFKTTAWVATYLGVVNPEVDGGEVDIPSEIGERNILPPRTRRPCGRPREL